MTRLRIRRLSDWSALLLACSAAIAAVLVTTPRVREASATVAPIAALAKACADDNPYFATTRLTRAADADVSEAPAVVAFYDTPDDDTAQQLVLATWEQVGAVYGLAYDWRRSHLYAAAYLRRAAPFGPGGPGQVYRIDMHTGAVAAFASMDAGPDRHEPVDDQAAAAWVGLGGLGDIEVDGTGESLLAIDLHDGRIHRFGLPDGRVLGAFPNGAATEDWADAARPFGLGVKGGWVYHGVVRLPTAGTADVATAYIFRSLSDGTRMTQVARFDLSYPRDPGWGGWSTDGRGSVGEPILADIEFASDGTPIVGFRDRRSDAGLARGAGDVIPLSGDPSAWSALTDPEHYADRFTYDESLLGGLAAFPGADLLVGGATAPLVPLTSGGVWLDNGGGAAVVRESVAVGARLGADETGALGDVEALCGPPGAPTLAPTPTPTATATATPSPAPVYLPLALRESCPPKVVDVVLAIDASTSMRDKTSDGRTKLSAATDAAGRLLDLLALAGSDDLPRDRAAIVGFNASAWAAAGLTSDRGALDAGLRRLADRVATGSRLDLALRQSTSVLAADALPGRTQALVLLSDGLPAGVPPSEDGLESTTVLRAAAAARATGAHTFAIGLGRPEDLDAELLAGVAGDVARYRQTPDAAELEEIYRQLASQVRCPPGRHPWGVPWP